MKKDALNGPASHGSNSGGSNSGGSDSGDPDSSGPDSSAPAKPTNGKSGDAVATRGLGRGLAGIIGDTLAQAPGSGVTELLGMERVLRSPEVRELVTRVALQSITDGFGADGVVLVRRDGAEIAALTAELGPSWNGFGPVSFEVSGRLWAQLAATTPGIDQQEFDGKHVLFCNQAGDDSAMAAAVVRSTPFEDAEAKRVADLVRSVGAALGRPVGIPSGHSLRVLTSDTDDGVLADVRLSAGASQRHAASVAETPQMALACAAAELCDDHLHVVFAGDTLVEGNLVNLVVLNRSNGGPLFGLSVGEQSATTGPAEAVFAAASSVGIDPFTPSLSRH